MPRRMGGRLVSGDTTDGVFSATVQLQPPFFREFLFLIPRVVQDVRNNQLPVEVVARWKIAGN
jgi:hypothetical protein